MDTDEAWERFCQDNAHVSKASVDGKLDTIMSALQEIQNDTRRTAGIVPSIMGDNTAVDAANAGAGMQGGMPGMDQAGGMPSTDPGATDDTAGDAMAGNDELPPGMPPDSMPPAGGAGEVPTDGMPDDAAHVQGGGGLEQGDDEDYAPTEDEDRAFEALLASLGLGGSQASAAEAAPEQTPDIGQPSEADMSPPNDLMGMFKNAIKDQTSAAIDAGDTDRVAELAKLSAKAMPIIEQIMGVAGGADAEAPAEAGADESALPVEPGAADAPAPADTEEPETDDAPETEPAPESDAPVGGSEKDPDTGSDDKGGDDTKDDPEKKDDDIKKSSDVEKCDGAEVPVEKCDGTEGIEKDAGAMSAGTPGAANPVYGEKPEDGFTKDAFGNTGIAAVDESGMPKDQTDTLSKSGTPSFKDMMAGNMDMLQLLKSLEGGEAAAEQVVKSGYYPQYNEGGDRRLDREAVVDGDQKVDMEAMRKAFDMDDKMVTAMSIFDKPMSSGHQDPDSIVDAHPAESIPVGEGHQDPTSVADAKAITDVDRKSADEGTVSSPGMADAEMERGEGAGKRMSVSTPTLKSEENGKHIMSFKEMWALAKSDRPGSVSAVNGDITTPEYGNITKSADRVRWNGEKRDPMDIIRADLEEYNHFKHQSDF